jgi:ribosomal protein S8
MNNQIIKFISLLKNCSMSNKSSVLVAKNSFVLNCVECLYKEGLILSYLVINEKNKILIKLRSVNSYVLTNKLKLVSKPSKPIYLKYSDLCRISLKNKVGFLSTSKGILTLTECKKKRIGGLFAFYC